MRVTLLFAFFFISALASTAIAKDDTIFITGRVKESLGKTDLRDALAVTLDAEGNPVDSCIANIGRMYVNGEITDLSFFSFSVPRTDSIYTIEVSYPRYATQRISFPVENVGKREASRNIPTIYLERAPRQLDEVTVTATKIKFYNRGDTVVFNADAFELAEGSMLDALITQLPGVELKEGGVILVNGEQVESLLLNGREFFDNNNELMLENIGAYTVKNIEVYKGYTTDEKWKKQTFGEKHLTMDVKLKREYNTGLTANAQVGFGTSDRYYARLFGLWFNNTTRLTAIGNFNNLNDTRKPGQRDNWQPEMMPSGTKKYQSGAFDYNYMDSEQTKRVRGDITYQSTINDNRTTSARTNFLTGGNTFDNSYSNSHNRSTRLSSYNYGSFKGGRWMPSYVAKAVYQDKNNEAESLSGTFSEEQQNMTAEILKALYSGIDDDALKATLNRATTRTDGKSHSSELQLFPGINYFVPKSHDVIYNEFGIRYRWSKNDIWRDYTVNYGMDPMPSDRRRQYVDNTPNTLLGIQNNLSYRIYTARGLSLSLNYEYTFFNEVKDSYQYALDRLADVGIFGQLPSGWANTLDPQNSYVSRKIENSHGLSPSVYYSKTWPSTIFYMNIQPEFIFRHSNLAYERAGNSFPVRKNFFLTSFAGGDANFELLLKQSQDKQGFLTSKHAFSLNFSMKPNTPKLYDLIDITDDSNPLNIYVGNPDLKVEYNYALSLRYSYQNTGSHPFRNTAHFSGNIQTNALTQGYSYNTHTGVRTNKMYNVSGNRNMTVSNDISLQFGPINQFSLSATTSFSAFRMADMIGENDEGPSPVSVNNCNIMQNFRFSWQIGKQALSLSGEYLNRNSRSSRPDFNTIDAHIFNYGIIGNFKLPYNFGINTDFNIYGRRGYGVKELDTNDAIWNVRLTWSPLKAKEWLFMIDGFDLLHQLSNVNYGVTATGRTVSYSNALPRYMLFSVQYRFNRKPKKRAR